MSAPASAARPIPAALPDTLFEIVYRPPATPQPDFPQRHAMAGFTPEQAVAVMVDTLAIPALQLTAQTDPDGRCWITRGPDGPRLARLAGMDAATINLALAAVDAGAFESIAA